MKGFDEHTRARAEQRGSALAMVLVMTCVMATMSVALLTMTSSAKDESEQVRDEIQASYAAEAALSHALAVYRVGGRQALDDLHYPTSLDTEQTWVDVTWGSEDGSMADDLLQLVARSTDGRSWANMELLLRVLDEEPDFPWGIFGRDSITMNSNSSFDAYDSSLGSYASQDTNRYRGSAYAQAIAPVASNGNISLDSNSYVFGNATPGPGSSASTSVNSRIFGSSAPAEEEVSLPEVDVPALPPIADISIDRGARTLAAGEYSVNSLTLTSNSTLRITGPSTIVVEDLRLASNSEILIDQTNGPVTIYVSGDFEQNSNTEFRPLGDDPADLRVVLAGDSGGVLFASNAELVGTVYAPERFVEISSNSDIFGAVVADELVIESNGRVHYDLNLENSTGGDGSSNAVEILCWRPLSDQQVDD